MAENAVGGLLPVVALLLPFQRHGALKDLYEILVINNRHYVIAGRWVNSWHDVLVSLTGTYCAFSPIVAVLLDALVVVAFLAHRRGDRAAKRGVLLTLALFACVVGAVCMQLKFCRYHWGILAGPVAIGVVMVARYFAAVPVVESAQRGRWIGSKAAALTAGSVGILFVMSGDSFAQWLQEAGNAAAYVTGLSSHEQYANAFSFGQPMPFSWRRAEELGLWLKAHSEPDDLVAVRGFEPEIYYVARRRFPGRFFWTTFLVTPSWSYRIQDWTAEDRAVFESSPPRYVLALDFAHEGPDSAEYFLPLGYQPVNRMNDCVILEKTR